MNPLSEIPTGRVPVPYRTGCSLVLTERECVRCGWRFPARGAAPRCPRWTFRETLE